MCISPNEKSTNLMGMFQVDFQPGMMIEDESIVEEEQGNRRYLSIRPVCCKKFVKHLNYIDSF